jgi:type III secretion system HrpE/YscL family protein
MNNEQAPLYVPNRKVIPREEFGALDQATAYSEQARKVYHSVQEFADKAVEEARTRGFNEGFDEGRRIALETLADEIRQARDELFGLEDALIPIVITAIEKIIGSMDDRVLVRRILRTALLEAGSSTAVTLRVAPEDLDDIRAEVAHLRFDEGLPVIKQVEGDSMLRFGEMILETAQGRVHIGAHQQIQRLRAGVDPGATT